MESKEQVTQILDMLVLYLQKAIEKGDLALLVSGNDGRLDSQANERQISHALALFAHSNQFFIDSKYELIVAKDRNWYDFAVGGPGGFFIPVNVKVSTMKGADNLSSKEGLFYALTGTQPDSVFINSWKAFCTEMAARLDEAPDADYYFLVVSKSKVGEVFWTSLKSLTTLSPSGMNPPYQCHWGKNKERANRTKEEAIQFLLPIIRESFVKGANPLISFDTYLKKFIKPTSKPN